jgi:hypothetical protein
LTNFCVAGPTPELYAAAEDFDKAAAEDPKLLVACQNLIQAIIDEEKARPNLQSIYPST